VTLRVFEGWVSGALLFALRAQYIRENKARLSMYGKKMKNLARSKKNDADADEENRRHTVP